jgi:ubiquinone/menaquinone biosynthesis C-methylase UbiE
VIARLEADLAQAPASSPAGSEPSTTAAQSALIGYGEAMDRLRADPKYADLIRDMYVGPDPVAEARRFEQSAEWQETRRLLRDWIPGARVVDLGAGTGFSSYAFIKAGAREVLAVEPWTGAQAGRDAIARLGLDSIVIVDARGEAMPIDSGSVDIVYARQTLHHADDLTRMLADIGRVLRPGGAMFTARDHVVDNDKQLAKFLAGHPVHQMAGGEHAYSLDEYLAAISSAGLRLKRAIRPWDSVINAFPHVRSEAERKRVPRRKLEKRFGTAGRVLSWIPGVTWLVQRRIAGRRPAGRPYAFFALKDG